jgi:hypothetical protein
MKIVVDLDGTLCDSKHREQHAQNGEWDRFHEGLSEDLPNHDVIALLDVIESSFMSVQVIGCTGRNERFRTLTQKWLAKYNVSMDVLLMRPDGDYRSDQELKPTMLANFLDCKEDRICDEIAFILEDRDKVVERWRELRVHCWQVRPGGY